jgi:class 3 adenylate cyclase/tetratricopeptide (TPR) repeat protein
MCPQDPGFTRETRTELLVDIVESTRLLERDEDDTVSRWRSLVHHIERDVLPDSAGRVVRSLGDGVHLDFPDVRRAVLAALAIQEASRRRNCGMAGERQMLLRMAIETGEVVVDQHDVYGRGVMLAARLLTVAGPGEIVVSAGVRDQLTPVLDADVEDLGECYLKHVEKPVRVYRLGPSGPSPMIAPGVSVGELLPAIAVIPFAARMTEPDHRVLGEVLADEMIAALSRAPELSVISRLSTTVFRDRSASLQELAGHLSANYVLSGAYRTVSGKLVLDVELAESHSASVVWSERLTAPVAEVLDGEQPLIGHVVTEVSRAIISRELQRARSEALPTLKSYALLMGAITLMHRLSPGDFDTSRRLLDALISRATRQAVPKAWMAKWHVLRVQQGWSADPDEDAALALECTKQALDADPDCSLALAIDGFVHTNLLKRLDVGEQRYDLAIETNPSESLAWLLKGTLHAFRGEGAPAVEATSRALLLSPLDPHRYFYESLAATAELAAHRFDRALALASSSLRANRTHTSTLRAMAIAQWQLGMADKARETARELLRLEPALTVDGWLKRSPSAEFEIGREWANVLREVGVPT